MKMISYASLERFEGDYAVCEVEQLEIYASVVGDFSKECYMADVPEALFAENNISMETGNVYSVEHDGENVTRVIRLEKDETKRRKEWLKSLGKKL